MTENGNLSEELLDGWLSMSMSIWNERLVTVMTYNESMVCNLLYKQKNRSGSPLTATDLCSKLQIRKPQMNVILNRLEKDGMILRKRSVEDKRKVFILLTEKGVPSIFAANSISPRRIASRTSVLLTSRISILPVNTPSSKTGASI